MGVTISTLDRKSRVGVMARPCGWKVWKLRGIVRFSFQPVEREVLSNSEAILGLAVSDRSVDAVLPMVVDMSRAQSAAAKDRLDLMVG